jgi:hypothetical protein
LVQSLPSTTDSMGKETQELRGNVTSGLRLHHISGGRGFGIGFKELAANPVGC